MLTEVFATLAFLEMLKQGQGGGTAPAVIPPYVPPQPGPGPAPGPVPFHIPPPGDIGPPPPGFIPPDIPASVVTPIPDGPPAPTPPPAIPVPVEPPAPPGTLPALPPWNQGAGAPCPASLPPFPGAGWEPDTPVSTAVAARATYWNPILWDYPSKTIAHATVCEQFGGRWMTFAAAWHPGDQGPQTYMATEAWRQVTAQPMPAPPVPVVPTPVGPVPVTPPVQPVVVQTPLQAAAVAMASALNAHGYKLADQPIYKRFQSAAKTTGDGFPGAGTMGLLRGVLTGMGLPMPVVPIYAWKSMPGTTGYDGHNAPTWQQWTGQAAPAPVTPQPAVPTVAPQSGPPPLVEPYPGPGAWQNNSQYIARYQSALTYLSSVNPAFDPKGVDGKYGTNTAAAVKAFQAAHGLAQDGQAGPATAAALDAAMGAGSAAA
jgi:hypothetical protein